MLIVKAVTHYRVENPWENEDKFISDAREFLKVVLPRDCAVFLRFSNRFSSLRERRLLRIGQRKRFKST